ncbi:adenylate/guanylate cyclase domain-containing protein [Cryptosporangium aurantiacum]|uniref:Adenylate cyclase, class 3 n=1 Tax=Cryptosporangium aurantiacum TaxID=134849 RepID=A0A1M7RNF2_9ACTN|nr:adenylate/guanylate cyclase domain-containing protein [Cryptosporangium aurantiacum]SHN47833.1 Adenylate cyclase, class 3 [Cryptosporangium aurantiacum]
MTVPRLPPTVQPVRAVVWALHLLIPLAALWLLLAVPNADTLWHHPPSHFWLVLNVAAISLVPGVAMTAAALNRRDARLFLVSLCFLSSAGFLLLHALATPLVLVDHANVGFDLSQPTGLAISAVFAAVSALPLNSDRVLALRVPLWGGLTALMVAWGVVTLLDLPPLNAPPQTRDVEGPLAIVALLAVALYLGAAWRYYRMHRRAPAAVLVSILTAFVLLAEAMVAVTLADKWHLSWWEWHLLLVFAFGFVAYSAYVQYRTEGSSAGLFDAVMLAPTVRAVRAQYEAALEELVTVLRERERSGHVSSEPLASRLAERFGLTERQAVVLDRAGTALAAERELSALLGALVAVGERARVGLGEQELLAEVLTQVRPAYGPVSVGLVTNGVLDVGGRAYDPQALAARGPYREGGLLVHPLTVKGQVAGVVEVPARAGSPTWAALSAALANQLSIAVENARLYAELSTLFRQYMSPDVAASLLADPEQAALGGSIVEVTALFADLRGFTTFSEQADPAEIVTMLNRYHGVAVPCILDNGGTVVQFVGDALLALFNAPARQPDHAVRAVRAGLGLQSAVDSIAAGRPGWPRFRVGINTGDALVGNIGSETLRGFNAMGDAVNVAARLQTLAQPGQVVVGDATMQQLGPDVSAYSLGELTVKGRLQPVRAHVVSEEGP